MRVPDEQKVCVRGMPAGVTEDEVRDFFGSCGTIVDIYLKDNGLDTFGFVGFESLSSQADAMRFDGRDFKGSNIRVEAKGRPRGGGGGGASGRDAFKVFVGGLARELSDDEIRSFFEKKVGPVTDYYRKEEGPFAFVGFGSVRDQAGALHASGSQVGSSRLRVEMKGGAPPPDLGDQSPSRSSPRRRHDSRTPPRRRHDSRSPPRRRQVSHSPPRRRHDSRSPPHRRHDSRSPPRRRRDSRTPSRRRHDSRSPPRRRPREASSPPPRRGRREPSSPPPRRRRHDSPSRSPPRGRRERSRSDGRRRRRDSRSPPRRRPDSRERASRHSPRRDHGARGHSHSPAKRRRGSRS
mmetsp:Transcript_26461/g.36869  ORF Transcript_26461/g.36869 Transcript_26461/m.36869 type:complete len:350 (-) Transcript_26461:392-1441(-)